MPEDLAAALDLTLAWARGKADLDTRRAFLTHPFHSSLVEADLVPWLDRLRDDVATGRYAPSPCGHVGVPKPNGAIRPGADLTVPDQVIYSGLMQVMRPHVQHAVEWGNPPPDYSYRLREEQNDDAWFQPFFQLWKAFDADSLNLISEGRDIVVTADIAGYYELIDLYTLRSDLNGLGVNREALQLLEACLHRWARVQRRGIPQGYSPSDILGKLYLNSVDRALADEGFVHRRWVDDFRIFCRNEVEARHALMRLIVLLGARGLVVQSSKTRIRQGGEARERFHLVHAVLEPIRTEFIQRLMDSGALNNPSATAAEIDEVLAMLNEDEPVEVLREAFDKYFDGSEHEFNKTLLRYLLRRLGSAADRHALGAAISYLTQHPEETDAILDYIRAVGAVEMAEAEFVAMARDGRAQYAYQAFQVLRWRLAAPEKPTEDYLRWVRSQAFEPVSLWAVRSFARATLGRWGTTADLERLQAAYPAAESDIERAEIVCSVARMEVSRRNGFLGHVGGDGELASRAARLVRSGRLRMGAD